MWGLSKEMHESPKFRNQDAFILWPAQQLCLCSEQVEQAVKSACEVVLELFIVYGVFEVYFLPVPLGKRHPSK